MLATAVRAGDPLAAWTAAARLLRHHYALITPNGQLALAAAMQAAAERLPLGTRGTDPALPFLRLQGLSPLPPPMQVDAGSKAWKLQSLGTAHAILVGVGLSHYKHGVWDELVVICCREL